MSIFLAGRRSATTTLAQMHAYDLNLCTDLHCSRRTLTLAAPRSCAATSSTNALMGVGCHQPVRLPRANPHSARGTTACHFPRFRSLKAFGRRPRCTPRRRDRPASETLNKLRRTRLEHISSALPSNNRRADTGGQATSAIRGEDMTTCASSLTIVKAASRSRSVLAVSTSRRRPIALAAASVSGASTTFGLLGLTSNAIVLVEGSSSRRSSKRFGPSILTNMNTPVRLPPGRLKLSTRPVLTGSAPVTNTIGMVLVAALAADDAGASKATITATPRLTSSPASEGKRLY